jgi:predicted transposase YdaD
VVKVMQLDYTFDRQILLEREEARTEGRTEGRENDIEQMLRNGRTPEEIAEFCGYDIRQIREVEARFKASCLKLLQK